MSAYLAEEVQFVADAQEKIVGAGELGQLLGPQVTLRDELADVRDPELHAGHPHGILVIAQAADAVLHIGLLQEDRVAIFFAPLGLVAEAGGDVVLRILGGGKRPVGLGKGFVEGRRTGEEA